MVTGIQNAIRSYSKLLSIACPLASVFLLTGMFLLASGPMRDIDFLQLYIAMLFIIALPLLGLKTAAITLKADTNSKSVYILSNIAIAADILLLCFDMVLCVIVGLAGTTGSY